MIPWALLLAIVFVSPIAVALLLAQRVLWYCYRSLRAWTTAEKICIATSGIGRLYIRRRREIVTFGLVLFILTANIMLSSSPAAMGNGQYQPNFALSADGGTSSESISSFSETSTDDVMFYPDQFENTTAEVPYDWDIYYSYTAGYGYQDLDEDDAEYARVNGDTSSTPERMDLYFRLPGCTAEGANIYLNNLGMTNHTSGPYEYYYVNVSVYDWTASVWVLQEVVYGDFSSHTYNVTDANYFSGDDFRLRIIHLNTTTSARFIWLDYAEVKYDVLTLGDSDHYAESFADVSDWTEEGDCDETTLSTDGDVLSFEAGNNGGNDWDSFYTDSPSLTGGNYYEVRYRVNTSDIQYIYFQTYTEDSRSGDVTTHFTMSSTTWVTYKWYSAVTVESVSITVKTTAAEAGPVKLSIDYLRIGPATEMGYGHDGSTTAGTEGSVSSDGSLLTISTAANFTTDTTATVAAVSTAYYPFLNIHVDSGTATAEVFDGSTLTELGSLSAGDNRFNLAAEVTSFTKIQVTGDIVIDWAKAYGIANFSVSQQSNVATDEVLYVEDNALVFDKTGGFYIAIRSDISYSVDTSVYNVWNLSISGLNEMGGLYDWTWYPYQADTLREIYGDETRGAYKAEDTLSEFIFRGYSEFTLSAITFIEDATAPTVVRSNANPKDPDDDEAVTLSSVVTDEIKVYSVIFDAISYPSGFSDVDYEATEGNDNLWTYDFSSLIAGYYCFKVVASDGANTASLTSDAYVDFTVRESEIIVDAITFFGVGEDFSQMQFSFEINKDATYVINEASENNPASDTHSGTASEGTNNIAWDKLTTTDSQVNFTITFTNGTLTKAVSGQYSVAQTALSVTERLVQLSQNTVTFSAECNKDSTTYYIYLDDVQEETGTINSGSFVLDWTRTSSIDPSEIAYALKFTDGTSTVWVNNTYDEYTAISFSIETLMTDSTGNEISVFVDTTWDNATVYLYQDDVLQTSGAEGGTLSYSKSTAAGDYSVGVKIDAGGVVKWANFTYTISAGNSLQASVTFESSGGEISVFVSTNWANTTVYVYQNDSLQTSGSEGSLSYTKATNAAEYSVGVYIDGTADAKWANFSYTVTATGFSLQSVYFSIGSNYITARATTSWGNGTLYLYEDDVQQDTGAETETLSYARSPTGGTYSVAFLIDCGTHTEWFNDTYTVAAAVLRIEDWSIYHDGGSYAHIRGHSNLAANYTVYEEGVAVATGSISAGSFDERWTESSSDVTNCTVYFHRTNGNTYTCWGSYGIAEALTFAVEEWEISLHLGTESYVEFYVKTTFENATIYAYDNGTLMVTATESEGGVSSHFWMREGQGLHNIVLNITHGGTTYTRNKPYSVPDWASSGLVAMYTLYNTQENHTILSTQSNWGNTTLYVYLNGSLMATSSNDPASVNFSRSVNTGTWNLTLVWDGGAQTYSIVNILMTVSEEGTTHIHHGGVVLDGDENTTNITHQNTTYVGHSEDEYTSVLLLIVFTTVIALIAGVILTRTYYLERLTQLARNLS